MIMQVIVGALFWIAFALFTAFKFMVASRKHNIDSNLDYWDTYFIVFSLVGWPIFLAGYMLYRPSKAVVCWLRTRADEEAGKTFGSGDL